MSIRTDRLFTSQVRIQVFIPIEVKNKIALKFHCFALCQNGEGLGRRKTQQLLLCPI